MAEYGSTSAAAARSKLTRHPANVKVKLLAVACLLFVSCNGPTATTDESDQQAHSLIGRPCPGLDVEPLVNSSAPLTLQDVAGQVTLINFWGPWCVPCRIEMPHIVELEKRHRSRDDFRLVSISCAEHPSYALLEETVRYVETQGIEFAVYSDAEGKTRWPLMDALGSSGQFSYPTTVLIDRDSNIRGLWTYYEEGLEQEVAAAVEQALAGQ